MPVLLRRALLSVSDKTGLLDLARELERRGVAILSTGGTARLLTEHGIAVTEVSQHTGFPEIMGGRVKTLHPRVHGGILMRELPGFEDDKQLEQIGGAPVQEHFARVGARPAIARARELDDLKPDFSRNHPDLRGGEPI